MGSNIKFEDLPNLILNMFKSKDVVIKTILNDIDKNYKIQQGLKKCCDSVIDNPSDENLRKMVNTTMKCVATQSDIISRLCIISLMYCGGNNYDGDATTILNKFGRGREAVQELFKRKFKKV